MITGETLRGWRRAKGMQAQFVANAAGLTKQQLSYIETGTRQIEVNEFVAIVKAMGYMPGDLLENSGAIRDDLKPIVEDLQAVRPATLRKVRDILRIVDSVAIDAGAEAAVAIAIPPPETLPNEPLANSDGQTYVSPSGDRPAAIAPVSTPADARTTPAERQRTASRRSSKVRPAR